MAWQDHFERDDFVALIRDLIEVKGMSALQAARAIGHGVTKGVVIGMAHRNKIKMGPPTRKLSSDAVPAAADSPAYFGPMGIMGLRDDTCKAPLWEHGLYRLRERVAPADIRFCGCKTKADSAYCESHHAEFHAEDIRPSTRKKSHQRSLEAEHAIKRWR